MVFATRAELGHCRAEGPEIIHHRLVNKDVAVGKEQDAFLASRLPQAPDNLKCGVGLAGARGHDQQDAVLALGNGFHGGVDGIALVIARGFAAAVIEVVLQDDLLFVRGQTLPDAVLFPQFGRRRKGVKGQIGFLLCAGTGAVVKEKAVAAGREHERDVE